MTTLEQVDAAIIAHKLEHGSAPYYLDASPAVFDTLVQELNNGVKWKGSRCIVVSEVPVFLEDDPEYCPLGAIAVIKDPGEVKSDIVQIEVEHVVG